MRIQVKDVLGELRTLESERQPVFNEPGALVINTSSVGNIVFAPGMWVSCEVLDG